MSKKRIGTPVSADGHMIETALQNALGVALYAPWEAWWMTLPGLPPPSLIAVL